MESNFFAKQIETYSNAIVAFVVIQGLTFVYYFGTNVFFNCIVKTSPYLAEGLVFVFTLIMILSVVAIRYLGRTLERLSGEFHSIVHKIYLAKSIVVLIFGILQIAITFKYGVLVDPVQIKCS